MNYLNLANEIKMLEQEIENEKEMLVIKENNNMVLGLIFGAIFCFVGSYIGTKLFFLDGDIVLLNPRISWIKTVSDAIYIFFNTFCSLPFLIFYVIPKSIRLSIKNYAIKKELKSKGVQINKKVSLNKVKFLKGELKKKKSELNTKPELKKESISSLTESQKLLYREKLESMYRILDFYKKNKNRIKKLYKNNSLDDLTSEEGISCNDINYIRTLVKKDLKR